MSDDHGGGRPGPEDDVGIERGEFDGPWWRGEDREERPRRPEPEDDEERMRDRRR